MRCRARVTTGSTSPMLSSRPNAASASLRFSSASPAPVTTDTARRSGGRALGRSARSILVSTSTAGAPQHARNSSRTERSHSSRPAPSAASQNRMRSAAPRYLRETSIPSFSTRSVLSRSPAVSTRRNGKPSTTACASMASRVVPGISVTIARSLPSSALNREDFPALGGPAITSRAPSRSRSPSGAVAASPAIRSRTARQARCTRSAPTGPSSSSGKSIS